MTNERLILFDRYISCDLSATELHSFQELLDSDPQFKEEYSAFKMTFQASRLMGELAMRTTMRQWHEEFDSRQLNRISLFKKPWAWVAASAIVLFGISLWMYSHSGNADESVFAEHFQTYPLTGMTRGLSATKFNVAYEAGKYEEAQLILSTLSIDEIPEYLKSFYTGICLLAQKVPQPELALQEFAKVLKEENTFSDQAQWYMALCYIRLHDHEHAKLHLDSISTNYKNNEIQLIRGQLER